MSSYKGSYVSDSLVLNDYVITPSFVQFAIVRATARNCIILMEVGREKMTKILGTL